MGTLLGKFTLFGFSFRSINSYVFLHILAFVVVSGGGRVVTGTEEKTTDLMNHGDYEENGKPQMENVGFSISPKISPHPILWKPYGDEDAQLLSFYPRGGNVGEVDTDGGRENHILSKRSIPLNLNGVLNGGHVRRYTRQAQNTFDRIYLCMFTLFANPNCRDQQNNYVQNHDQGSFGGHPQQDSADNGGGTYFSNFLPTVPPNNNQNGFGGLFGNNGIFGGGFGLNPSPQQHFTNNYNPFFQPSTFQPSTPNYNYYPHQQLPIIHQTPYPEQQIHRRPGSPPTPSTTTTTTTTTTQRTTPVTYPPTTQTTTTPTTTTTRPTTTPTTTRRTTSYIPITTTTTSPRRVDTTTTFHAVENLSDCENGTGPIPPPTKKVIFSLPVVPTTASSPTYYPDFTSGIKTIAKENSALKSEVATIRQELTSYQVQNKYLQDALSTLQGDNTKLKGRVGQLERTNDHLQQQNGQLQHSTGDMRTQLNEARVKVKYAEEKMVKLARQGIEDQKQLTRTQNRVRDLNKENNECKSQLYQLQLRHTQRIVQESVASSTEIDLHGGGGDKVQRFPQQIYRDDILSTSTEQLSHFPQIVEFDDDNFSEVTTTGVSVDVEEEVKNDDDITTTTSPEQEQEVESRTEMVEEPTPVVEVVEVTITPASTTTTPVSTSTQSPLPSTQRTIDIKHTIPESVVNPSQKIPQRPTSGIIFNDDDDQFGLRIVGAGEDSDETENNSDEVSVIFGNPIVLVPENVTSTPPTATTTTTSTPRPNPYDSIFPSLTNFGDPHHQQPDIIFDDDDDVDPFGLGVSIVGADELENDDESNEVSIMLGNPGDDLEDPDRSLNLNFNNGQHQQYSPANYDAFSSFNPNQRPNSNPVATYSHPFNNYWPYQQFSGGMMGPGGVRISPGGGGYDDHVTK